MSSADPLSWLAKFEAGHYRPVTFLERGVALPFTTPTLLGSRVRPGQRRAPELVLANPAGSEGVYIIPWGAIEDIAAPTLHDRALLRRVATLPQFSPRHIRAVARAVAAEGFAGRAAARAAETINRQETEAQQRLEYRLLVTLIRQGELAGILPPDPQKTEGVERRAHRMLRSIAATAGIPAIAAFEAITELASLAAATGLRGDPVLAAVPALMEEITTVFALLEAWAETAGKSARGCLRLLREGAEMVLRSTRLALAAAHAQIDDLCGLIRDWTIIRDEVANLFARPEWLVDGWATLCALWRAAAPTARRSALMDMAALVPVMPCEVTEWCGFEATTRMEVCRLSLRSWRRKVPAHEDWISGRKQDCIARHEMARAFAP